jgi:serine/threonine-protein kinase
MTSQAPTGSLESQLRSVCADLERQLRAGSECRAEDYLSRIADDEDAAVEVIYTEFATRYQLGQSPPPDEFLDRFPHWRDRLSRLFDIHHLFAAEARTWVDELAETTSSSPIAAAHRSGHRIGKYVIVNELGRGAMGIVYAARQIGLERMVALKVVPLLGGKAESGADGQMVHRFRNEAKAMAALQHPNIVQVFDVGVEGPLGHLAMELVDGGNLTANVDDRPAQSDRAAMEKHARWSAELVMRLARAAEYAHQRGVTHRDLKPANILLTSAGEPKIADFGLARCCTIDGAQTTMGGLVGTPSYMAPEQAAGESYIGPAADIYALGAILYELLSGQPPFSGGSILENLRRVLETEPAPPRQICESVPRALETICLKCLEKEPSRRYGSADALADDLARYLAGEPILAVRTGPTRRLWSWCRRKPLIASLAAALAVSVVAGFALVTWQWRAAEHQRQIAEDGWSEAEVQRKEADRQRTDAAASLRQAHDAVHTYFTLVSDSTLLDTPGMQPLRSQLLQSALDHYLRFQQSGRDSPALRVDLAASYFRVAQLHHLNDRNDESVAALARGVELSKELLRNPPDDPGFPQRLAGFSAGSGRRLHRYTKVPNDPRAAGETIMATIRLWERFAKRYPHVAEFRVDIATLSGLLGEMLYEMKQYAEAEKSLRLAKAQWPPLLAVRPDATEWHAEHGRVALALGDSLRATDQYAAAEAAFGEAIEIFERLTQCPIKAAHHRGLLASTYYHLGLYFNSRNRPQDADLRYRQAADVFGGLLSEYPHLTSAREGAASVLISRGELLIKRGDAQEARPVLAQAVGLLEQLNLEYPKKTTYRRRLNTARELLNKASAAAPTPQAHRRAPRYTGAIAITSIFWSADSNGTHADLVQARLCPAPPGRPDSRAVRRQGAQSDRPENDADYARVGQEALRRARRQAVVPGAGRIHYRRADRGGHHRGAGGDPRRPRDAGPDQRAQSARRDDSWRFQL